MALSAPSPDITTSWRAPLEPSMMVMVFWSVEGACGATGFTVGAAASEGAAATCSPGVACGNATRDDRLAAQWIVVENGEAGESHQKQAEQHRQRLDSA